MPEPKPNREKSGLWTSQTHPILCRKGFWSLGGSPTSVDVAGSYALVTVDNSAGDFLNPAGVLKVIHIPTKSVITTIDLGGQPDAVTVSRNQRYAAITMENQRDEDVDLATRRPAAGWIPGDGGLGWAAGSLEVTKD